MTWAHQMDPFGHCTIAFYVCCFIIGMAISRFATWLSRQIRMNRPRTFRFQDTLKNMYKLSGPEFTMVCGPVQSRRYAKQRDLDDMEVFLRKMFPEHVQKLPENLISVWIPRENFEIRGGFQQFEPVDGMARGSWLSYQMVSDRVQATIYNVEGTRYMAGMCIYMRTDDEWWWWTPAIERGTVRAAMGRGPKYELEETAPEMVAKEPPSYEELTEPPSYTSLLMEH